MRGSETTVAIAKSLHIDEITTSHFTNAPRNDKSPSEASEMNLTTYRPNDLTSFLNPSQPCLGFAPRSQSFAFCTYVHSAQSVRYPDSLCSVRAQIRSLRKGRRIGFTLAEVLITLGIISVVAALTLPSVVAKFQQKSFATAFKKEYSNVNNAINMLVNEEDVKECYQTVIRDDGGHLIYSANNSDCYALKTGFISKLKLTKIKKDFTYPSQNEVLNQGGVTANSTVAYDGWIKNVSQYAYLSPDGAVFIFSYSSTPGDNYREIPFIIDVNGKKGPNRWGYDVFWLSLVKNGNGIRLSDEYATLSEKGGSLPRNILLNNWSNDYNKNVNWGLWK